jgi:hypothetical protein
LLLERGFSRKLFVSFRKENRAQADQAASLAGHSEARAPLEIWSQELFAARWEALLRGGRGIQREKFRPPFPPLRFCLKLL